MLLENPSGPYPVGATTFALPIRPTRVFGTAAVRTKTGQIAPALRLVEVSFTAYYPVSSATAKSRWKKWLDWFPRYVLFCVVLSSNSLSVGQRPSGRPLADAVRGYSLFAGELAVTWNLRRGQYNSSELNHVFRNILTFTVAVGVPLRIAHTGMLLTCLFELPYGTYGILNRTLDSDGLKRSATPTRSGYRRHNGTSREPDYTTSLAVGHILAWTWRRGDDI